MELLVGIGIMMLLLALALMNINQLNRSSEVSNAAEDLSTVLREAQSNSMAVINEYSHGVYLNKEDNTFVLFEGNEYNPLDLNNVTYTLNSSVKYKTISLEGGGASIIFQTLTGSTPHFGEIIMTSKNDDSIEARVTISSEGKIASD